MHRGENGERPSKINLVQDFLPFRAPRKYSEENSKNCFAGPGSWKMKMNGRAKIHFSWVCTLGCYLLPWAKLCTYYLIYCVAI